MFQLFDTHPMDVMVVAILIIYDLLTEDSPLSEEVYNLLEVYIPQKVYNLQKVDIYGEVYTPQ